jgi:membrane-associated phospholipid phosphatase
MYVAHSKIVIGLLVVFVYFSILFIDKPLAVYLYSLFGHVGVVASFKGSPTLFILVIPLLLLPLLVRRIIKCEVVKFDLALIACALGQAATQILNSCLKVIFGRSWPLHHHPALIGDGIYQFKFFQFDPSFHSFPSGHAASISALMTILWAAYPKFRTAYAAATLAMSVALVVGDYHFLSDVLAGVWVGCFVASPFLTLLRGHIPSRQN